MFCRDTLAAIRARARGRVGYICSAWDLLHAGHCLVLEFAKSHCDTLVVGLHRDPSVERDWKNAPVQSLAERRITVAANRHVDAVIEYDTEDDHREILVALAPAVRVLGSDYIGKPDFTASDLAIPVVYHDRDAHGWSTSDLRRRIREAEDRSRRHA